MTSVVVSDANDMSNAVSAPAALLWLSDLTTVGRCVEDLRSMKPGQSEGITDAQFIRVCSTLLELCSRLYTGREDLACTNLAKLDQNLVTAKKYLADLEALHDEIERRLFSVVEHLKRSKEAGSVPILLELAEKMGWSTGELKVIILLQLEGTGVQGSSEWQKLNLLHRIRLFSGLQTHELLSFFLPDRKHMKEGLLELTEDEFGAGFEAVTIKLPREVLLGLSGLKLSAEDALKIDTTSLAEVLTSRSGLSTTSLTINTDQESTKMNQRPQDIAPLDVEREELFALLQAVSETNEEPRSNEKSRDLSDVDLSKDEEEPKEEDDEGDNDPHMLQPYSTDLEYCEDAFKLIVLRARRFYLEVDNDDKDSYTMISTRKSPEAIARELDAKERKALRRWTNRTRLTRIVNKAEGGTRRCWLPRTETLGDLLSLSELEKLFLLTLVGGVISQSIRKVVANARSAGATAYGAFEVGMLISMHCPKSLAEQISSRSHFYKKSPLIKAGILHLSERRYGMGDLTHCEATVDRRMLDFVLGLDTEIGELVEGGTCFSPQVSLDQVILPAETKSTLLDSLSNYASFVKLQKVVGLKNLMPTGRGLVILLHGAPGTGKTMTAQALANHIGRKLLSVDLPSFSQGLDSSSFNLLFREAKLQNAVIFLDECEPLFESRDRRAGGGASGGTVNIALRALDSFEGIMFLATNRPFDLDEAMMRRISISIELQSPGPEAREKIWRSHVPQGLQIDDEVNFGEIASDFELNGGYIKNAMLQALKFAASRDLGWIHSDSAGNQNEAEKHVLSSDLQKDASDRNLTLTKEDIIRACKLQVRGNLHSAESNIVLDSTSLRNMGSSAVSFSSLVLASSTMNELQELASAEKTRRILGQEWGFDQSEHFSSSSNSGSCVVFAGAQGVGKTFATRALGLESGRPLRFYSWPYLIQASKRATRPAQRRGLRGSMGESAFSQIFREAHNTGAIVVIERASGLFNGSAFRSSQTSGMCTAAESLIYHISKFPGTVIFSVTTPDRHLHSSGNIEEIHVWNSTRDPMPLCLANTVTKVIEFKHPTEKERAKLWRILVPEKVPLCGTIDFQSLAKEFPAMVGASIKAAVYKGCTSASRRPKKERTLKTQDLREAALEIMSPNLHQRQIVQSLYM